MGTEYYYARDDERVGPVSSRELRRLVVAGVLGPDDLVWAKPLPDWVEARTIPGLFPANAGPPSSVTSPADRMPLTARIEAARRRAAPLASALGVKLRAVAGAARVASRRAVQYWRSLSPRRQRQVGLVGGGAALLLVVVLGLRMATRRAGDPSLSEDSGPSLPSGSSVLAEDTLSANEVYAAFKADPEAAGRRYVGKRLRVRGELSSTSIIGYSTTAPPEARINTADTWLRATGQPGDYHLNCHFKSRELNMLGNAQVGDEIVVEGVCKGLETRLLAGDTLHGVRFDDCRTVWSPGPGPFDRTTATRRQFVNKMKATLRRGGWGVIEQQTAGEPFTLANFDFKVFINTFGQPDSGFDGDFVHNDVQNWTYLCSDGAVRLSVECGRPFFDPRTGEVIHGLAERVIVRKLRY